MPYLKHILTKDQALAIINILDNCRQHDGKMCRLCRHDNCLIDCKIAMLEEKEIIRPPDE